MSVNILMLAAGNSTRFGHIKQLANIQNKTLIEHSIAPLMALCKTQTKAVKILREHCSLYIALGANQNRINEILPAFAHALYCAQWSLGMGSTIAEAISKLPLSNKALLITLADQPLVPASHYQQMLKHNNAKPRCIIATLSGNNIMPPVIFPQQYTRELQQLSGDKGAISLIKKNFHNTIFIECEQAKYDCDTPQDLIEIERLMIKTLQQT